MASCRVLQAGSAGADQTDECLTEWDALGSTMQFLGAGWSSGATCFTLESDATLDFPTRGALVLDDEGRIVEVSGYHILGLEDLDSMSMGWSDRRYPCYAGDTINYECTLSL